MFVAVIERGSVVTSDALKIRLAISRKGTIRMAMIPLIEPYLRALLIPSNASEQYFLIPLKVSILDIIFTTTPLIPSLYEGRKSPPPFPEMGSHNALQLQPTSYSEVLRIASASALQYCSSFLHHPNKHVKIIFHPQAYLPLYPTASGRNPRMLLMRVWSAGCVLRNSGGAPPCFPADILCQKPTASFGS